MARKQKEKIKLIETVQFEDVERAQRAVQLAKFHHIRVLIGLGISISSTIFVACALWGDPAVSSTFWGVGALLALLAYMVGGGIGKAIKAAAKITKFAWFIIPVFPADVLCAIGGFILSVYAFLFVPIVFVGLNYIQHRKTLEAAEAYLAECGYAYTTVE